MDSGTIAGIALTVVGVITLILLGAAEAGVIAGVRERVLREPAETPAESLRRFYQERQLTLSSLALARNLASVGVTAVVVYLALTDIEENWLVLAGTVVFTALNFLALQGFTRSLVAREPDRWQKRLRPFVALVRIVFRFPVMLVDAPMGAVLRAWQRGQPGAGGGKEELMLLAEVGDASAGLQDQEREMIRGVMELEFTAVREVMIPRPDIVAVEVSEGFERLVDTVIEKGFSRIPVYEGDVDHILGIAHAKGLMRHMRNGGRPDVQDVIREAYIVPESKKVHELLADMKARQISIAIVVDEYGGTAGLVTVEDLVEEIVGEIRDEFDVEEIPISIVSEQEAIVDARVSIDDLNDLFKMQIEKEDFDSVGGFIVNELGRMPSVGDTVRFNGVSLKVLSVTGRRIRKVRVTKVAEHAEDAGTPA
jgi:CBS domain containing-hemolysin-like protein